MQIQPYLFFEGRCEAAIAFYRQALDAEVVMLSRFGDMPPGAGGGDGGEGQGCAGGGAPPPAEAVMHAELRIGESRVLVSDGFAAGKAEFKGVSLALSVADDAEAGRRFEALADGGHVEMPLGPSFFSTAFGVVRDRFGVSWMVVGPEPVAPPR
ncbi:VOC family protein [Luteimonas sp. Y-2-2-4F]|nr:VOC family protein [Luteimonas sp. Y-2-2-4F]MCD9031409.1 VOC family protein [Luteimonas sp. Y-2-2-4F]